jgi:diadenosine tetraphosphate (Ap4A) HIT family hydrolase
MILHPQLERDGLLLGQLDLCAVLFMRDANYPWLILVPQREGVTELYQLSEKDQQQFIRESSQTSRILNAVFDADKINVAALGNMVPQLHIHHVVRYQTDIAWPAPVWGFAPASMYDEAELESRAKQLQKAFGFI